jgi:hypothetical protein
MILYFWEIHDSKGGNRTNNKVNLAKLGYGQG